jgi:glutathione synthase/RimK-type ligase-like ATP-grasp enzyme
MRRRLLAYGVSNSSRELANAMSVTRIRNNGSSFRPRVEDVIINWGNSTFDGRGATMINEPAYVGVASSKLASLRAFAANGVYCPRFTTDKEIADDWKAAGETIVGRGLDRANSGRGITLTSGDDLLPDVPLYTVYSKKLTEYRVFVVNGRIVRTTEKRIRRDTPAELINRHVRNLAGGWVYCQESVNAPPYLLLHALKAVESLGLDFGAVDVGWNDHYGVPCVYEVNTAFGLEGETLDVIASTLRRVYL